jgi:Ca2+-binding RTX toxin-like protein
MDCGDGTDVIQYQGRTSTLNITLDGLANDGETGENDSITSDCENVESWNGADKVVGSSAANRLSGRDGNDSLKGAGGNDRLYGGAGKDNLSGEAGNDYLSGEAADDTISGGSGTDTVYGGEGNDSINVKDGVRDVVYCGGGAYDAVVYDAGIDEIDIGTCERRN